MIEMPDTPAAVLASVREFRSVEDAAARRQLLLAVSWASMHSVDSLADAAHLWERSYGDTGVAVAGSGAPLVAEFSVASSRWPSSRPRWACRRMRGGCT